LLGYQFKTGKQQGKLYRSDDCARLEKSKNKANGRLERKYEKNDCFAQV